MKCDACDARSWQELFYRFLFFLRYAIKLLQIPKRQQSLYYNYFEFGYSIDMNCCETYLINKLSMKELEMPNSLEIVLKTLMLVRCLLKQSPLKFDKKYFRLPTSLNFQQYNNQITKVFDQLHLINQHIRDVIFLSRKNWPSFKNLLQPLVKNAISSFLFLGVLIQWV